MQHQLGGSRGARGWTSRVAQFCRLAGAADQGSWFLLMELLELPHSMAAGFQEGVLSYHLPPGGEEAGSDGTS